MNARSPAPRYGSTLIALHWLMLVLLAAVYLAIELRVLYPRGSGVREGLKTLHYVLGLTVFALVWLRLLARLAGRIPDIIPNPPRWQLRIAHAVEFTMYLFLVLMPLMGWMMLSAEGKPVSLFGLPLPALIGANASLAEQLKDIHTITGKSGYALVGLHALGALFHHYVQRDNTLRRMLPGSRPLPDHS